MNQSRKQFPKESQKQLQRTLLQSKKSRSKIFFLINSLEMGGAERVVTQIASALKNDYDVSLVLLKEGVFYQSDVPIKYFARTKSLLGMLALFPYYIVKVRELAKEGVVISFLDYANFVNIAANKNAIISVRNHIVQYEGFKGFCYKIGMKLFHPFAKHIVVNSAENAEDLATFLRIPKDRFSVIYNPLDLTRIKSLAKQPNSDLAKISGKPLFVIACRLVDFKQVDVVLRAFAQFLKNTPQAQLIVLGDGPQRKELERFVNKNNLSKNIFILGPKENIFSYYAKADCVLFGSRAEGYPNSLLEALALKKPIITTHFKSGSTEVIFGEYKKMIHSYPAFGPNGILVSLKNPVFEIAQAMTHWNKITQKQKGISQYDIQTIQKQWKQLIQKQRGRA